MPFQSIKRILPGAIRQVGLETQVTTIQVIQTSQDALKRLWGEEKASLIEVRSYVDGVLRLHTSVPAAAQEIKNTEIPLMNEINHLLGAKKIVKIQCFIA